MGKEYIQLFEISRECLLFTIERSFNHEKPSIPNLTSSEKGKMLHGLSVSTSRKTSPKIFWFYKSFLPTSTSPTLLVGRLVVKNKFTRVENICAISLEIFNESFSKPRKLISLIKKCIYLFFPFICKYAI